jgi:hypothetical protein
VLSGGFRYYDALLLLACFLILIKKSRMHLFDAEAEGPSSISKKNVHEGEIDQYNKILELWLIKQYQQLGYDIIQQ